MLCLHEHFVDHIFMAESYEPKSSGLIIAIYHNQALLENAVPLKILFKRVFGSLGSESTHKNLFAVPLARVLVHLLTNLYNKTD